MTRKVASLLAVLTLALGAAAHADEHGGAIPNNFSFYESSEFADIQWATGRNAEPAWGSVVLEGASGVRFVPDNGAVVKFPYSDITAIKYERIVKQKEKVANQKWFKKPLGFTRGVDTYRAITIEHNSGEGRTISTLRVDELSSTGILRILELKTGLRAKKLSSF
jgi:hypothetical protein